MRPEPPPPPAVIETHISMLVLTGDRVLKFRKPVVFDFCDFSSLEARRHDCEREVELNRRLAPDVYLGVGRVAVDDLAGGGDGEPCVVMRRLPAERQLSTLVTSGHDLRDALVRTAATLADFHCRAERSARIDAQAMPEALGALWGNAVEQLRVHLCTPPDRARLDDIGRLARDWLDGRRPLFTDRVRSGHVCDGHGDLRGDNIFCLDDGPRVLDCIEFDDRLRYLDVATDLAFLVMDLRRLGRPDEAEVLIAAYEEHSGHPLPRALLDHGAAYWALVRAKVAHLRAAQGDDDAAPEARALVTLAHDHLRRARPRLVLVGGLPASGKSTVAQAVSLARAWPVVSSDRVRKELAGVGATERRHDAFGEGLYDAASTAATYTELLDRARIALARGESVVLDASWSSDRWRTAAAELAADTRSELHELRCAVDPVTARARLAARASADRDPSDADVEVAEAMARIADHWPSATPVDTTGSPSAVVERVLELLA